MINMYKYLKILNIKIRIKNKNNMNRQIIEEI